MQDYPDYWTQGETLDDLKEHLKDMYQDITSGLIAGIGIARQIIKMLGNETK
ncbi:hypothetical protein GCM10027190_37460 [Spirosoma areae]